MRDVAVIGCGMTKFGRHDNKTLMDLLVEASLKALEDSGIHNSIDSVYVSSMLAGELTHQTAVATALTDQLGLLPAAAERIENGPASGGSALKNGFLAVASGFYDIVLVTGGEKMRHVPGDRITDLVATMTHPQGEYVQGVTLPSLAAMFTRLYMSKYGVTSEDMARVAVKNHSNALMNPYAHIHSKITLDGILFSKEAEMNNPVIADPLRLYDFCPVSDGAASIVLCSYDKAKKMTKKPIKVAGFGQATDTLAVHEREDPTTLKAVRLASAKAFEMAKLKPDDIKVAELHDAFTILEIAESEEAGFFKKGQGHIALRNGETSLNGKLPINTSGGLKARGHPVGGTGISQFVELTWQLRGEAGDRQVKDADKAFCCNFGGFGNNVTAFILSGV
jgi:acetyl-CoA C-acetyltransferase